MKPALWITLLVVVGASVYVASQDDEVAEPVTRGRADQGHTGHTGRAGRAGRDMGPDDRRAGRQAEAGAKATDGRQDETAARQRLAQYTGLWVQRRAMAPDQPGPPDTMPGAWASQLPPPPPPPPEPPPPPPPPPPMAPPFPHQWVGRYVDGIQRAVIAGPSQTWVIKAGDVIEGQWRVDHIQERQMQLTYLPLQQIQTLGLK